MIAARPRARACGAALLIAAAGCRADGAARPVVVFAAASLTAAFTELGRAFAQQESGFAPQLVFEGSPSLVLKLQQGATADVLATADQANMDQVVAARLTATAPVEFARNQLAIVVAKGNPKRIAALADLARADLKVALCAPTVPAGRYAREALQRAGVALRSISDETSVTALCGKVHLGELDAAIAYRTDVQGRPLDAVALPAEYAVTAHYPIAVLASGRERAGGERFVAFVRSDAGRRILRTHGFEAP